MGSDAFPNHALRGALADPAAQPAPRGRLLDEIHRLLLVERPEPFVIERIGVERNRADRLWNRFAGACVVALRVVKRLAASSGMARIDHGVLGLLRHKRTP